MSKVSEFTIEVPAKWVLSGEHSVLRGKSAVAFPLWDFKLTLSYQSGDFTREGLLITANPFQSQIKSLLGRACEWLGVNDHCLDRGELEIKSEIPIGAGLGSSAALCVAVARFVLWKTQSDVEKWVPLATHLEDVFHGKSSGMDVSVIARSQPMIYSIVNRVQSLPEIKNLPKFQFFDSGLRGLTRDCIQKVQSLPAETLLVLDQKMEAATELAIANLKSLGQSDPGAAAIAVSGLAQAMNQAQECFEAWGLVPARLLEQKKELLKQGALAVKLTGAGMGGFWVALFPV